MNSELNFRNAERKDSALILHFIKSLAEYEKMLDEVVAEPMSEWTTYRITGETLTEMAK